MPTTEELTQFLEGRLPYDRDDLQLIGDWNFVVGVPRHFPAEFKKYVFAGAKAAWLGNKSIDYTLKRHGDKWNFEESSTPGMRFASYIADAIKQHASASVTRLKAIGPGDETNGRFAAWAALARLIVTFRAVAGGLLRGWHFEVVALERLILEQLAWCSAVYHLEGEAHFDVLPTDAIRELKAMFPFVGRLYGRLSETSHIHPDETLSYITIEGPKVQVLWTSTENLVEDAAIVMTLMDLYLALIDLVGAHPASEDVELSALARSNGTWSLREDRPFAGQLAEFAKHVAEMPRAT